MDAELAKAISEFHDEHKNDIQPVDFGWEGMCDLINNEVTPLEMKCVYVNRAIKEGKDLNKTLEELQLSLEDAKNGMKAYYGIDI